MQDNDILLREPSFRGVVWVVLALFLSALLWAVFGKIDEVAVAEGRIIPAGYTQVLQAEDKGIVHKIFVRNGQKVKQGDALLELDRTMSESDLNAIKKRIAYYKLDMERIAAEQRGLPFMPKGYDKVEQAQQEKLYNNRMAEKRARVTMLDSQIAQKQQELAAAQTALEKSSELLVIATDRAAGAKKLWEENGISRFNYMDYQGRKVELERAVATAKASVLATRSEIASAVSQKQEYLADWDKKLQEAMLEDRRECDALEETERKAELKNRLVVMKSPVDGIVHQMEIHTLGTVVREAEPLLAVVPKDTPLEAEIWISNKDIGFVKEGQKVSVKVETYNFQKYGTVSGELKSVSPDSVEDPQKGPRYKGIVALDQYQLALYPGMTVSAEIKTREKRIIDFFLEPFQTYKNEAFRER